MTEAGVLGYTSHSGQLWNLKEAGGNLLLVTKLDRRLGGEPGAAI